MKTIDAKYEVGSGATINHYSDSIACSVISISKAGGMMRIQEDTSTLLNGVNSGEPDALQFSPGGFVGHTSGKQRWDNTKNPVGIIHRVTLRTDGKWKISRENTPVSTGKHNFYDFNL